METPRASKSATDVGGYCSCIEYSASPGPLILTGTSNAAHLYPPLTPSRPFPGNAKEGFQNGGNRLSTHALVTQLDACSSNGRRLSHQGPGWEATSSSPTSRLPVAMSCGAVAHSGDINAMKACGNGRVLTCGSSGRLCLVNLHEVCMPCPTTSESGKDHLGAPPSWYPEAVTESGCILQDSLVGLDVDVVSGNVAIAGEGGRAAVVRLDDLTTMFVTSRGGTLPLAGTAFQGPGGAVFATCGWAPHAQLQVWDARRSGNVSPVAICQHPSPDPYLCIVNRPLTPEVFVVGTADGDVVAWDVRAPKDPLCNVKAGPDGNFACGAILGLACHPQRPRHFLSCDEEGRLLVWDDPRDGQITCQMLVDVGQPLVGVCYDSTNNVAFTITANGAFYTCSCPAELRV